jgi:hypothetical protein
MVPPHDEPHRLPETPPLPGTLTWRGELRHHCAIGEGALYIIGVWESEERVRTRWASEELEDVLTSAGFPSPKTAEITILELHATEPPL